MTSSASSQDRQALSGLFLTGYFAILAGLWISPFFPEARLWGLDWFRYFGSYWLIVVLILAACLPWVLSHLQIGVKQPHNGRFTGFAISFVVVYTVLAYLLRAKTFFLGDGYQVLAKVQATTEVIKPWDRPIWTIQSTLYDIFGGGGEPAAIMSLQFLSLVCGLILLAATVWVSSRLYQSLSTRIIFIVGVATGGYMLLFFGYVENYPLFVTVLALFALDGLMVVKCGWPRWTLIPTAATAMILHPFGVCVLPALLYGLLRQSRFPALNRPVTRATILITGLVTVTAVISYAWHQSYFVRFSIVPPVADIFTVENYTMFSVAHLLDYANLLLTLFPGVVLAVATAVGRSREKILGQPEDRFLFLLLLAGLAIVFIANPRLGMPRDWDLFGFVGVPLGLLSLRLLLAGTDRRHRSIVPGMLAVALGLLFLTPRVLIQASEEKSIQVIDRYSDLDLVKSRNARFLLQEYLERQGRTEEHRLRGQENTLLLPHDRLGEEGRSLGEIGHYRDALQVFRRALRYDPLYPYAWANMGVVYRRLNRLDSAIICLRIADGINPYSFSNYMKLAGTHHARGELEEAERYWLRAALLKPDDIECRSYLMRLYREQERDREYGDLLEELIGHDDAPAELFEHAARRALDQYDTVTAISYLNEALRRGMDTSRVSWWKNELPELELAK